MNDKKRIFLIRSSERSDWLSQNQVHDQLEKAYRAAFPGSTATIRAEGGSLPGAAAPGPGGEVVLLDHHLEFSRLASGLETLLAAGAGMTVHLFADFLNRPEQISAAAALGARRKAKFFVASRWMRAEVLKSMPGADVGVLPSPVSGVFFETPLRKAPRAVPRWAYAGRIHPDKGLNLLLEHLLRLGAPPFRFELLGAWSDTRYASWSETEEDFASRQKQLKSLIDLLGLKPRLLKTERSLAAALGAIDACVFPSIFKCEEFGYALAQSLAAGKSCWISDWRGHRDFAGCPGVRLIPVREGGGVPKLDFPAAFQAPATGVRPLPRDIRNWARANHSVAAAAERLRAALQAGSASRPS